MANSKLSLQLLCLLILTGSTSCNKSSNETQKIATSVTEASTKGAIQLFHNGEAIPIVVQGVSDEGTLKLIDIFASDIERVSGVKPIIYTNDFPELENCIIIGQLGANDLIDSLARLGKINPSFLEGKWETSLVQVVKNPLPGIKNALVIAGSDKRGTIFGMFELSRAMGVSPWYWWADVPVQTKEQLYIKPGIFSDGEPKVKYRGIFINDEAPALTNWAFEKFGGFNHQFYSHVFELILRHRGNYCWPAMWGRSFNYNDTLNPYIAKEYGIVMGKSHHEPMNRAHVEWSMFGDGPWDYTSNSEVLDEFWKQGMKHALGFENILSVGMRGDGDEPMSEESNIELLKNIINRQREIMEEISGEPAEEQPQLWALYKEVLDYYNKGMRVPNDITLLLCDDNWGNVRSLPKPGESNQPGGYGMYYHFDYVGGPRNYKWLNVSLIPRIWQQMQLTYQHGVDKIWIVNVGDIKPMELPISFFLDFAWNPNDWPLEKLPTYTTNWSKEQFGETNAQQISKLLTASTKINNRRTPEMLDDQTYSLENYNEFEWVVHEYQQLAEEAIALGEKLPEAAHAAYYQLVDYPIAAMANLYEMYYTVALNKMYARQQRVGTNPLADKVEELFEKDQQLSDQYHQLNNGKWNHMMSQTHIGYTYWQQPEEQSMPMVHRIKPLKQAKMGICINNKGSNSSGNGVLLAPVLYNTHSDSILIDIYNLGQESFQAILTSDQEWLSWNTDDTINIKDQKTVKVNVNWEMLNEDKGHSTLLVAGSDGSTTQVKINAVKRDLPTNFTGFISSGGYVSIEATNFTKANAMAGFEWKIIPDLGRTTSSVTLFPTNKPSSDTLKNNSSLEYNFYIYDTGMVQLHTYLSPALDIYNKEGMQFAVAIDDQDPVIVNMQTDDVDKGNWYAWVGNDLVRTITPFHLTTSGAHTLRVIAIDNGIVIQKFVLDLGNLKPSYLGPPASLCLP